jgi:hypothetical protein
MEELKEVKKQKKSISLLILFLAILGNLAWLFMLKNSVYDIKNDDGLGQLVGLAFLVGAVVGGLLLNVMLIIKRGNIKSSMLILATMIIPSLMISFYGINYDKEIKQSIENEKINLELAIKNLDNVKTFKDCQNIYETIDRANERDAIHKDCLDRVFNLGGNLKQCLDLRVGVAYSIDFYKHMCVKSYVQATGDIKVCNMIKDVPLLFSDTAIKSALYDCESKYKNAIVIESKYEAIKMARNNSEGLVDFINKYQSLGEIESSANYNIKDDYWNVSFYPRGTVDLWYEIHISQQGKIIYEGQGVGG